MTKSYEFTREIFNSCSNNQMRDVFFEELELDDDGINAIIREHLTGSDVKCERSVDARGMVTADIEVDGLRQRLTFCP